MDARRLAERPQTGRLGRVVYKAPRRYLRLRELARVYGLLSRDVARSKNRLKSLVRRRGIDCSGEGIYKPGQREDWLGKLPAEQAPQVFADGESILLTQDQACVLTTGFDHLAVKAAEVRDVEAAESPPLLGRIRQLLTVGTPKYPCGQGTLDVHSTARQRAEQRLVQRIFVEVEAQPHRSARVARCRRSSLSAAASSAAISVSICR